MSAARKPARFHGEASITALGFVMLLDGLGKARVEIASIARPAPRLAGARAKLWLSHWARQTHPL